MKKYKFTYQKSGVNINASNQFIKYISKLTKKGNSKNKFKNIGSFGSINEIPKKFNNPLLVSSTDGVGTKLELLLEHDLLEIAGKDLVAMSINDIITTGADPIMFLDYVGVGKLDKSQISRVISGIVDWCEACDCILAGGETAEMPGLVGDDMIELSGFGIGAAEKSDVVDPTSIAEGDVFVGYPSDGIHANGWSLVRKILSQYPNEFNDEDVVSLLATTRLYHDVLSGYRDMGIKPKAMAHITGGGLEENLSRINSSYTMIIDRDKCKLKGIFLEIMKLGNITRNEMYKVFNCGIGFCLILDREDVEKAKKINSKLFEIGYVSKTEKKFIFKN